MGFINQFPYSDYHELNLDWVIKQTKESAAQISWLIEEFNKLVILTEDQINMLIQQAILQNNRELYQYLADMKAQITTEYQAYCNEQIISLKNYTDNQLNDLKIYTDNQDAYYNSLAQSYADHAVVLANAYTDTKLIDYTYMVDPITGEYKDVRDVVTEIVEIFHTEGSLTASEYDNLELTAQAYDSYDLSAYDYDFNGKNILT